MLRNALQLRWVSTSNTLEPERRVPDIHRQRRLWADEPLPPMSGTEVSQGRLRSFTPDTYVGAGIVNFGSADATSPFTYKLDTSGVANLMAQNRRSRDVHIFHGTRDNCLRLVEQLEDSRSLTEHPVRQGLITASKNTGLAGLSLGASGAALGVLIGGPVGAAAAGGAGAIIGILLGTASGIAQAISLEKAGEIEESIKKLVEEWIMFLDNDYSSAAIKNSFDKNVTQPIFAKTSPPSIQYLLLHSLLDQITEIQREERRLGSAFRNFKAIEQQTGSTMRAVRTDGLPQVLHTDFDVAPINRRIGN